MIRQNKNKKLIKLVTHDGSFHADDIFACATLSLMLEKDNQQFKIIRTRDQEIIDSGDYVFDVGGIYDANLNRFDHHQKGGAGEREEIPYAAFGLVWKKFGKEIVGTQEMANIVENKLVMPVDANDNGIDLYESKFSGVLPYTLQDVLATFSPTALEDLQKDEQFIKAFSWGKEILQREIKKANDQIEINKIIKNFYEKSKDKRLVIIDKPKVYKYEIWDALQDFSEPLFAISGDSENWRVTAVRKEKIGFGNRKDFPKSWAGLRGDELVKVTGVLDAIFCHRGLFLAVAKSKEGAIKLAQIAIES